MSKTKISPEVLNPEVRALMSRLREKHANWQVNCDRWVATSIELGAPIDKETEIVMRHTDYAEAADIIDALAAQLKGKAP